MTCPDLCTAAKCEELEARIGSLEQDLALLKASFDAHVLQRIPEAHLYSPTVKVETFIINTTELVVDVKIDEVSDFDSVTFPELETFVTFDIFPLGNNKYEFKCQVNGDNDSDILDLGNNDTLDVTVSLTSEEELQVAIQYGDQFADDSASLPNANVSVDFFNNTNESAVLKVQVGNDSDEDTIYFPEFESDTHVESNLKINGSYQSDILTITVDDGESEDSVSIFIDADVTNINNGGGGGVSCSEEIDLCCSKILNGLADLSLQLSNAESIINQSVNEVFTQVTVDVSSTVCSDYTCEFPTDDNDQPLLEYAEAKLVEKQFSGTGIAGINERLKYLASNQDVMYKDICKAIDPIRTISKNDFYQFCNDFGILRSDYQDSEQGTELYDAAVEIYLAELATNSKYGYLLNDLDDTENPILVSAPASYINNILTDFSLIQAKNNSKTLCAIASSEPTDVVSIVASDKVIPNASGKFLVLHFVELGNYPKRTRNSSYWQIQIPAARENYDWNNDFKSLRWQRGNQYAELRFEEFKNPVSGFFANEAAANIYFDAVLNLTTATEKNRVIPLHSNPDSSVIERETRPYRGFLESVNSQGQAICHVKYVPPVDAAND